MERATIACGSCKRLWTLPYALTLYEKRALQAHPCPHCGASRLTCREPRADRAHAVVTPR